MHEGHRKRMMTKAATDVTGLNDHELLEIVLFRTIPRKNTNPLAHELLASFGSLAGVFHASYEQLLAVEGIGETTAAYIQAFGEIIRRLPVQQDEPPKLFSVQTFLNYLSTQFVGETVEYVDLYCLDSKHHIKFKKRVTSELGAHVSLSTEEVSRTVVAQNAYGLVIVHNHPTAPAVPSTDDNTFTEKIAMLCALSGILFCDHIIVGQDRETYSYYLSGKLDEIRGELSELMVRRRMS